MEHYYRFEIGNDWFARFYGTEEELKNALESAHVNIVRKEAVNETEKLNTLTRKITERIYCEIECLGFDRDFCDRFKKEIREVLTKYDVSEKLGLPYVWEQDIKFWSRDRPITKDMKISVLSNPVWDVKQYVSFERFDAEDFWTFIRQHCNVIRRY